MELNPKQLFDLTPSELIVKVDQKRSIDDIQFQSDWNRMRILYSIIYNSNVEGKHRKEPYELMPFEWDEKKDKKKKALRLEEMSTEERMKLFEKMDKAAKKKFNG